MIRATKVHAAGDWTADAADTVVLDFDDRHRRRTVMSGVQGLAFLLDLPDAVMLRGGDALELEDGRLVEVVSAPESLLEIRAGHARDLIRLAWHIGNRHLPAQLLPNAIRIRQDHVIADMLRGLGAKVTEIDAPFDPEGGAYASSGRSDGGHGHGAHDHGEPGHKRDDGHGGKHKHDHEGEHAHKHDHGHKHEHGHAHGHHHD